MALFRRFGTKWRDRLYTIINECMLTSHRDRIGDATMSFCRTRTSTFKWMGNSRVLIFLSQSCLNKLYIALFLYILIILIFVYYCFLYVLLHKYMLKSIFIYIDFFHVKQTLIIFFCEKKHYKNQVYVFKMLCNIILWIKNLFIFNDIWLYKTAACSSVW